MKLKDKIKSYSFWVSLASAVILILKVLGNRFGFTVDETMVSDLFTALCSILVLLGIIVVPTNQNIQTTAGQTSYISQSKVLNKSQESTHTEFIQAETTELINKETNSTEISCDDKNVVFDQIKDNTQSEFITNTSNETVDSLDLNTINDILDCENFSSVSIEKNNESAEDEINKDECDQTTPDCVSPQQNIIETNTQETIFINNQTSPVSNLKEIFDNERSKFSQNINEYIFELQEEIRRAREKM